MCYTRTDLLTAVWIDFYSHAVLVSQGRVHFPKDRLRFPDPNSRARFWDRRQPLLEAMCHHNYFSADISITNLTTTTMAPNLAFYKRVLIQSITDCKLQGDDGPIDDEIAEIADCTARAVRRIRSNLLRFGTTTALPNSAGRPKTIAPPMLTALYDQLSLNPCMRLEDMADFLQNEFDIDVIRLSVSRALKKAKWSKKMYVECRAQAQPQSA